MENTVESWRILYSPNFIYPSFIYKSFDDGFEVGDIFLDISVVFGKVWQERLTKYNICNLLNIITDFSNARKQNLVLHSFTVFFVSGCLCMGTPRVILSSLLFLIYINEVSNNLTSNLTFLQMIPLYSVLFIIYFHQPTIWMTTYRK